MRSLRVLVVEQHPARLLQLHQMLNACGVYNVRVAEDCHTGRDNLDRQGPADIVVFGSQAVCAPVFLEGLAEAGSIAAVIIQGPVDCLETAATVRRARQAGLWVLGTLPLGEATCPLHALLRRFTAQCTEPLIA
jgi:CheY-like chemotaxis protein